MAICSLQLLPWIHSLIRRLTGRSHGGACQKILREDDSPGHEWSREPGTVTSYYGKLQDHRPGVHPVFCVFVHCECLFVWWG